MSDVLDITEQLQRMINATTDGSAIVTGMKAADEILRLRAENEKLRAALKPFAELEPIVDTYGETLGVKLAAKDITEESIRAAAAALKETGDD